MYSLTSANRYYLYQGFVRMNLELETRLIHITQIMREQYYLQKAMAFGWTA